MSVRIIVNITKEGQNATIHDGITSNTAEKIFDGKITKTINLVDTFTFSLYKNNSGYDMLESMITQVNVTYNGEMIFIGRVLTIKETMDSDGLIIKNVVCEGRLGWLNDTLQPYATYRLTSGIKPALQDIIRIHNNHVDESRQMTIGNVDIEETNEYQYVKNWDTTLETIMDKFVNRFGGELQLRDHNNGVLYLDYLSSIGEVSDTTIELAVNLRSISQTVDGADIVTRLYPLGAKVGESGSRLMIGTALGGNYLDDENLIRKYGVIVGKHIWDNVTTKAALRTKGQAWLDNYNKIRKQYKISAYDLSTIDQSFEQFKLGNSHRVINPLMGIDETLRIVKIVYDLNDPYQSELTVGDIFTRMTGYTEAQLKYLYKFTEEDGITKGE